MFLQNLRAPSSRRAVIPFRLKISPRAYPVIHCDSGSFRVRALGCKERSSRRPLPLFPSATLGAKGISHTDKPRNWGPNEVGGFAVVRRRKDGALPRVTSEKYFALGPASMGILWPSGLGWTFTPSEARGRLRKKFVLTRCATM